MKQLNTIVTGMPSSGIRKLMGLSENVEGCIHLEVGQPDFKTPQHILDAVSDAAQDGFTRYTYSAGIAELRNKIAEKVKRKNGFEVTPEQVVVSAGAVCNMYTALLALVEPGEEVLLPNPGWPNYTMQMYCIGAKGVYYPLLPEKGFTIDFDALESLVGPKTKAMVITTPGNPTGQVYSRDDMQRVVEFCNKHDIYLISDEIYEDIIFDGEHTSAGIFDTEGRVVTIFGFSKTYAVTGLRVGYSISSPEIAPVITKLQEPVISCASGVSQKGCVAALTGPEEPINEMIAAYKKRRDAAVEMLKENGLYLYTPKGAFYILIDISQTSLNSDDFALKLLKEDKVAVAPGETFGDVTEKFIRISFAVKIDELKRGMEILCRRIKEW